MKSIKGKLGHRVWVIWMDSASEYGWQREVDWTPSLISSVGILVECNKDYIVITDAVGMNGSVLSPLSIPWCSIKKFKQYEQIIKRTGGK